MAEQAHQGPIAEFCAGLRQLQQKSGLDRAVLARRVGYSRSQLYEILEWADPPTPGVGPVGQAPGPSVHRR